MSRLKPREEYEKTRAFRFFRWLSGSKDPYLGEVEMKPQEEWKEEESVHLDHIHDHQALRSRIYDTEHNKKILFFYKLYKLAAVLFCVGLAALLLYTVSYLPKTGAADRPANNEVPARYIEKGLQETGAVNIVTGMILDYRAFDTFGESNVLFVATVTVLILLHAKKNGKGEEEQENDRIFEPKNDAILQAGATILVPVIMLFGVYIVLNGHLSPGGGFPAAP